MSDLHRAVEAELDAHRPTVIPPFSAVRARKRARDQRRAGAGAAVLGLVAVAAVVFVPSILSRDDGLPSVAAPAPETETADLDLAARLCADAAHEYDGEVAAAYGATVQAVRDYMADPHDTGGDPAGGPVTGAYSYPTGWSARAPDDAAAACYIDADFPVPARPGAMPADRALIMATEGAAALLAAAGPKENLLPAPLAEAKTAEPEGDAGPTRYTITYASDTAYTEREQAVQACLDRARVAYVSSEDRLPPVVGFTVTGADENTALRKCVEDLDGVLLAEEPPRIVW